MSPTVIAPRLERWRRQFGEHLRQLRTERALTQEALAEQAGVDRKLIYRTELGQTSPRLDAVVLIADALQISVTDLIEPRRKQVPRR